MKYLIPFICSLLLLISKSNAQGDNLPGVTLASGDTNCTYTFGTVNGATTTFTNPAFCDYFVGTPHLNDVFYNFVAIETQHVISVIPIGNNSDLDIIIQVLSYNGGTSYSEVACFDEPGGGGEQTIVLADNINIGETYYIRIYDYGAADATSPNFDICILHIPENPFDLYIDNESTDESVVSIGDQVYMDCDQNFSGTCDGCNNLSPNPEVGFFLSTDQNYQSGSDLELHTESTTIGESDASEGADYNWTVPNSTSPGNYYILFVADYDNQHGESDEGNNVVSIPITITSPCTEVSISQQPSNQTVTSGNTAIFSVTVSGTSPFSYQWRKNGTNISGANSDSYTTPTLAVSDNGDSYSCYVTNCGGSESVLSNSANVSVSANCNPVSISQNPQNQSVTEGSSATFSVSVSGTSPFTYQWIGNGAVLLGATSSSYTTSNLDVSDDGDYYSCQVTNCNGQEYENSNNAYVYVSSNCDPVYVTQQPQNQYVNEGQTATFSVSAGGTTPFTYQWRKNGAVLLGATSSSYTTSNLDISDDGDYYSCQVTNCNGQEYENSNNAYVYVSTTTPTVTVNSPNGGESFVSGENVIIISTITGEIISKEVEYSIDGGNNWETLLITSLAEMQYTWEIPNYTSAECLVKVTIDYLGGTSYDISNSTFTMTSTSQGIPFDLDDNLSHLFWPYDNSTWDDNPNSALRDGWIGGSEGSGSHGYGEGGHTGTEFFADDWNRLSSGGDCDATFYAPLSGTVIFVRDEDPDKCICWGVAVGIPCGSGNRVIIQSDYDNNYAFYILHLNDVYVSEGQYVNVETPIGGIGSTGNSNNAHAHVALFKNIYTTMTYEDGSTTTFYNFLTNGQVVGQNLSPVNPVTAKFKFDAILPGVGGTIIEPISVSGSAILCQGQTVTLTAPLATSYFWNTGETSQSIIVDAEGEYFVSTFNQNGNLAATSSTIITEYSTQNEVQILNSTAGVCTGASSILSTNFSDINNDDGTISDGANYQWSTGETSPYISVTQPGTYSITYQDPFGCTSSTDEITITEFPNPTQPTIQANENQLAASSITNVTYQWLFNGEPIEDATTQFHTATEEGYYTILIIDVNGCSSISDPVFLSSDTVSTFDIQRESIKIYPNPSTGKFIIEFEYLMDVQEISIYNLIGQKVSHNYNTISSNIIEIDITNDTNPIGIYYVKINTAESSYTKQIILMK
jgi:murein DD-endopeptidase MepM/ murein hydrolase activator NlpD